ncbi:MAG: beta-eliminating lyase-related protein [Candidatus Sphingomonas phytovorans]|nr:beta-eliminating lyase-related protein [Sphingomonas sp.]WEK00223.1 MAG: beta-eliminating lyase-related protein [Sphingomonas sp.]
MSADDLQLKLGCIHLVSGHRPLSPPVLLTSLATRSDAATAQDFYGSGGAIAVLENRVADLLGKERALFFVNGVTAQLATLKQHAERAATSAIALHPLSHIDTDECGALERGAKLAIVRIGHVAPFGPDDLDAVNEPLAAVVVELPLRRAGYRLPELSHLRAISDVCRARGTTLHFDGARLWEAAAGYGIPVADLAALADSVYVSFYKGLGGLGGAIVAGTAEFVNALGPWKSRFGGNQFTAFPQALAALSGLDTHLPAMPRYIDRARALAARLAGHPIVNPATPDVNAFQLLLPGDPGTLMAQMRDFARHRGIWLFNVVREAPLAGHAMAEVVIGDGHATHSVEDAANWIEAFLEA